MTFDERKEELLARLQTAAELEMSTIPPYMIALLSITREGNRGVAENIRSVMMEEMLHLALVSNVISSLGGKVRITDAHVPSYPLTLTFQGKTFADRQFEVHLAPFSEDVVKTFMAIEQPRERQMLTARLEFRQITLPENTIGEFYASILKLMAALAAEDALNLFNGSPDAQIGEDYYWSAGGKPVVVTDLDSANDALDIVIEQGEGSPDALGDGDAARFGHPFEVAHYFRFREILERRRYVQTDKPSDPPSGAPIPVDYSAVYPIKVDPRASDYVGSPLAAMNQAFNAQYSRMLEQLEEALNGNPKVLYNAIMNGMHGLSDLAIQMMRTPIPDDPQGLHGCPSFEWVPA